MAYRSNGGDAYGDVLGWLATEQLGDSGKDQCPGDAGMPPARLRHYPRDPGLLPVSNALRWRNSPGGTVQRDRSADPGYGTYPGGVLNGQ